METVVVIDGREVKFRATAAVPRLYRIKFRRDMMQDMVTVKKALERKEKDGDAIPMEALEMFESMAYVMAKHADPALPANSPEEWLESFNMLSIYQVFPIIQALWAGNTESLIEAKKKLGQ